MAWLFIGNWMKSKQRVKIPNNGCLPKYIADFINKKVIRLQIGLSIESFTSNLVRSFRDNPNSFRKKQHYFNRGLLWFKIAFPKKIRAKPLMQKKLLPLALWIEPFIPNLARWFSKKDLVPKKRAKLQNFDIFQDQNIFLQR